MRINEFQKQLKKEKIDLAVFFNISSMSQDDDLVYFTGYKGIGALIVPKTKKPFLIVPEMEYGRIRNSKVKKYKLAKKKKLFEEILTRINKNRIKKKIIGINKNVVTLNIHKSMKKHFKKSRYKDISQLCSEVRQIKTKEEISRIKKACNITDKIFSLIVKNIKNKKLKTELNIVNFIEQQAKKNDCELAFYPVVASGKGASTAHYEPQNIRLRKGFLVLDFGVRYKNYNSDMTRTIFIGKPTNKDKELYNLLLKIQKATIKNLKLKKKCEDSYNFVVEELKNYAENFNHGLGHGIGIKVHELPNLTHSSKDKIQENMVFTVEPGIYFENKLGIRIEDTILMKTSPIRLTKSSKDLLII